jgi:hypothetical protein
MSSAAELTANRGVALAPLDLVSSHPWQRAVFTTYALSLSFFEAVVLDALVRGGGRESLILADVQGVRASLSEQGAHRVGRDYEVEPVRVSGGVFHPKISVFAADKECHVLVGSGNLTFGGWGGNCEVLEHLHPSFAADAIEDAASFFDLISVTERIRYSAAEQCAAVAGELRKSALGKPRNGNIRLFHSLDISLAEQISQVVRDLGGAVRMVAAAPFWDDGSAIDRLCEAIGLDHFFVHAHPHGCVEGFAGTNWPTNCRNKVQAIQLDVINAQGSRRLHGKLFEIVCKRGRVIVSGSANGTAAALDRAHNIEACVVRIQRTPTTGWTFRTSDPPEFQAPLQEEQDSEEKSVGVLRAILDADELAGEVLVPRMSGRVSVSYLTSMGAEPLGKTDVSADSAFRIAAPALEERSWLGGRLVIRVTDQHGRAAEGFVSVASYAGITRRAGAIGRRLFAVLAGTETPQDVAAIISWFYEDPQRLADTLPSGSGSVSSESGNSDDEAVVSVADLAGENLPTVLGRASHEAHEHRNWARFMEHIFSAFRQQRESLTKTNPGAKTETEEEEGIEPESEIALDAEEAAVEKSLSVFDQLFDLLLSDEASVRNLFVAFDLTHYLCGRLQPEITRVKSWLQRLIPALVKAGVPAERREDVAATILLLAGMGSGANGYRWAREYLLPMSVDICADIPSMNGVPGFRAVLPQRVASTEVWAELQKIRTYPEQVRAYLLALNGGTPSSDYGELAKQAFEEWPVLEDALTSAMARQRILELNRWQESCPRCHMSLPMSEVSKLQSFCVGTAKNCCGRVILWTGA